MPDFLHTLGIEHPGDDDECYLVKYFSIMAFRYITRNFFDYVRILYY